MRNINIQELDKIHAGKGCFSSLFSDSTYLLAGGTAGVGLGVLGGAIYITYDNPEPAPLKILGLIGTGSGMAARCIKDNSL